MELGSTERGDVAKSAAGGEAGVSSVKSKDVSAHQKHKALPAAVQAEQHSCVHVQCMLCRAEDWRSA